MAALDLSLPAPRPALALPRQPGVTLPGTMWATAGASLATLLVALAAHAVDPRLLDGIPVWLKPAKFALSLAIHFASLALVLSLMSPGARERLDMRLVAGAMVVSFWFEMGYIAIQAGRSATSHWNFDSGLTTALYSAMGVGAVVLTVGAGWLGSRAGCDRGARMAPGLRAGVLWGFPVGATLTLVVAGWMSSTDGHFVGVPSPGAATIPFLGWSAEVGDFRPPHFLALHAMQALPLLGIILDRAGVARPGRLVVAATAGWALLTLAAFAQALMGLPLVRL